MNYLVVDLEATCDRNKSILPDEQETIEIGAVMVDGVTMRVIGDFDIFVRPTIHPILTDFCKTLTGIEQKDVNGAAGFQEAFTEFRQWYTGFGESLFCSWGRFDKNQFQWDCKLHGMQYPFRGHLDLSKQFKVKYKRVRGSRGAMKFLGVVPKGHHHRGIDDAKNIAAMLPMLMGKEIT